MISPADTALSKQTTYVYYTRGQQQAKSPNRFYFTEADT